MNRVARLLLPALFVPAAAQAQTTPAALPDPATIAVPDVTPSANPQVRKDGYKFYYFHNPEVSFAEAWQDLKDCRGYLVTAGPAPVPGFIPWDEAHRRETRAGSPMAFGVTPLESIVSVGVTSAMAAIILPKMERGQRSNKMRRCMGTRGYVRYAIPEAAFDKLNDGQEDALLLMQAKLASGPKPQDQVVPE